MEKETPLHQEIKFEKFIPWSLLNAEKSKVFDNVSAVTNGSGTATHTRDQPKDLHVDDS